MGVMDANSGQDIGEDRGAEDETWRRPLERLSSESRAFADAGSACATRRPGGAISSLFGETAAAHPIPSGLLADLVPFPTHARRPCKRSGGATRRKSEDRGFPSTRAPGMRQSEFLAPRNAFRHVRKACRPVTGNTPRVSVDAVEIPASGRCAACQGVSSEGVAGAASRRGVNQKWNGAIMPNTPTGGGAQSRRRCRGARRRAAAPAGSVTSQRPGDPGAGVGSTSASDGPGDLLGGAVPAGKEELNPAGPGCDRRCVLTGANRAGRRARATILPGRDSTGRTPERPHRPPQGRLVRVVVVSAGTPRRQRGGARTQRAGRGRGSGGRTGPRAGRPRGGGPSQSRTGRVGAPTDARASCLRRPARSRSSARGDDRARAPPPRPPCSTGAEGRRCSSTARVELPLGPGIQGGHGDAFLGPEPTRWSLSPHDPCRSPSTSQGCSGFPPGRRVLSPRGEERGGRWGSRT